MPTPDPTQNPGFKQRVLAARLVQSVETAWPALWPALAVLGLFAVTSLFGLWLVTPVWLHLILLLGFLAAFGTALWRAREVLRLADRHAGLARLERDSGAAFQPLRALEDRLPESVADPFTQRLWAMHRERLVAGLARIRLAPPRSLLPVRDPWAFRAALLLVLVVALVHARDDVGSRLVSAFSFRHGPVRVAVAPRLDLWVTPPAYTHRPPLGSEQTRGQRNLAVPAGSIALAQVHHREPVQAGPPRLTVAEVPQAMADLGGGSAEAKAELKDDGWVTVSDAAGNELGSWFVDVAPDAVPTVIFQGTPSATHRGVLKLGFEAKDDYGVAELALVLSPLGQAAGEEERLPLVKPANQPPTFASSSYLDLTAHPLAGLPVRLRLEATDGLGQKGQSEPMEITLPAREFNHPLARAIIEQRRHLVAQPGDAPDVAGRLAALAETDAAQQLPTSVPLSLRVAAARLSFNQEPESRRSVVDLLWELALFIEDGSLSLAERKLRDIQDQLQKALSEGKDDKELEQLMQEMQQALNEFLDQLSQQAMQQPQQAQPDQQPQQGQRVERQDLQQMLDRARELMKSGAKDAARQMLSQLQQMLENLRAGTMQAQPSQGQKSLSDLQKMIKLQQQLLDKSFQMDRQQRSGQQDQQGQQGQQPGQQQGQEQGGQQPGQGGQGSQMGQASTEQEALRRALGELMRRLGEAGMEIPRALGQAELQMRNAKGSLDGGEPGGAAEAQNQAVDSMQRAGQAMMEQLSQQQAAQQQGEGGPGDEPAQQPGRQGRDPLGRSTRNEGGFDMRGVEVPEQSDLGRARGVLEELYRRSGDQRRPPGELDYYRRLLDRL